MNFLTTKNTDSFSESVFTGWGGRIKTLQSNMGHHSAAFTLDVYGHCTDEMKVNSSKKMENLITSSFAKVILSPNEKL